MLCQVRDRYQAQVYATLTDVNSAIIIAQHRPYVTKAPEYLPPTQQQELQSLALQRVKSAAASTTYILNDLVSSNLIELSPISLTTAMMAAMQVHLYEYHKSTGLSRQCRLYRLSEPHYYGWEDHAQWLRA